MSNLQREIVIPIKIGKVETNYSVKFPTVGRYIQVESRKSQLATPKTSLSTQYLNMIRQGTIASNTALDIIDMIAWFEICMPDLMKNISGGIESIEDLDIFDAKPLLDVYKSTFKPWLESWEEIFYKVNKVEEKEEKGTNVEENKE